MQLFIGTLTDEMFDFELTAVALSVLSRGLFFRSAGLFDLPGCLAGRGAVSNELVRGRNVIPIGLFSLSILLKNKVYKMKYTFTVKIRFHCNLVLSKWEKTSNTSCMNYF